MGPQLFLDKSTLQSFSYEDTLQLCHYYLVVYPPILYIEILGDLKKVQGDDERSRKIVAGISHKMQWPDSIHAPHYRFLLAANLMGHEVEMDGRPMLIGGSKITDDTGRTGVFFEEQPEREALRRWIAGEFTEAEHTLSAAWRLSTRAIDLRQWQRVGAMIPTVTSIADLKPAVEDSVGASARQFEGLRFLVTEAGLSPDQSTPIFDRWPRSGMPQLRDYAPYAYYCLTVFASFYVSLASRLIGTRSTNRVDLEYLLYLPFCRAFSSNDDLHKILAPVFLNSKQDFIDGRRLKDDLSRIRIYLGSLSGPEREKHSTYPPDWEDSITNQLWNKHMLPRSEYRHFERTLESDKRAMEHLRPMIDAIERIRKPKG